MIKNTKNPFIAGNWVRGKNFFGRQNLITEILEGNRNYCWVAGTRRFGKTSLLKQIELLTTKGEYATKFISLFWDLQGSQNINGLKEALLESVEDAEERFDDIGVNIGELESLDVFGILRTLRRKAKEVNLNLMLLCDEAEELINIEKNNPETLPKLRRFFQRGENIYTILTATKRLSKLEESSIPHTSPFLYGFVPPAYLTRLSDEEAKRLIGLGGFDNDIVTEIIEKSNNHPYLIQLICKRLFETGDLKKVIEEVSVDDMIGHFFSVDFQYLQPKENEILLHILQNKELTLVELQSQFDEPAELLIRLFYELMQLGFVKQEKGRYKISNYFFAKWLEREKEKLFSESTLQRAASSIRRDSESSQACRIPTIGDKLGQHEILEKIGSGGMGIVFKGRDIQLNRIVALKVLLPELMSDSEFKQRFIIEARAASSLNHPNIATIFQIGEEGDISFISMEYIDGQNLKAWSQNQALTFLVKFKIAIQAGTGLAQAHKRDIVHRDVKSDNIMVTKEGEAKIMDFGLAKTLKRAEKEITLTGTTLGTLGYMSPEQASGLATDHRTDIFSYGVVLYELFTGELPFSSEFELSVLYAIMNENPKSLRNINPELPEGLEEIVEKALQKDKENRYQKMDELVVDLENLIDKIH